MQLLQVRLSTYKAGAEVQTVWSFTPLRLMRSYAQAREATTDGEGRIRRRPMNIRDAFQLKIPAGLLLNDGQFQNFLRLLMAHKVEFQKSIAGKMQWLEYDLDADGALPDPDHPEDVDRLRSYTLKFVAASPTWYTDFESAISNFDNS
jgi:hypothetical protein